MEPSLALGSYVHETDLGVPGRKQGSRGRVVRGDCQSLPVSTRWFMCSVTSKSGSCGSPSPPFLHQGLATGFELWALTARAECSRIIGTHLRPTEWQWQEG